MLLFSVSTYLFLHADPKLVFFAVGTDVHAEGVRELFDLFDISPLYPAGFASPDTNFTRESIKNYYLSLV